MSGKYQHDIPQSLQRGFAVERKPGKFQVTVYDRDRGIFSTAPEGVAGESYFYSHAPASPGDVTLDDRITAFESGIAAFINQLRTCPLDSPIDAALAGSAVAHYSIRAAHGRRLFTEAVRDVVGAVGDRAQSPEEFWRTLKLDQTVPSKTMRDIMREAWREDHRKLRQRGLTQDQFERVFYAQVRQMNPNDLFSLATPAARFFTESLLKRAPEIARKGHTQALDRTLAPPKLVERLSRLIWSMQEEADGTFILPDHIVSSRLVEGNLSPLFQVGEETITQVLLPVSHRRLLVGSLGESMRIGPALNAESAACCWQFFIARERRHDLETFRESIRAKPRAFLDGLLHEAERDPSKRN